MISIFFPPGLKKIDRDLEVLHVLYLPAAVEHQVLHQGVDLGAVDHQDLPVVQDHVEVRDFERLVDVGCWLLWWWVVAVVVVVVVVVDYCRYYYRLFWDYSCCDKMEFVMNDMLGLSKFGTFWWVFLMIYTSHGVKLWDDF